MKNGDPFNWIWEFCTKLSYQLAKLAKAWAELPVDEVSAKVLKGIQHINTLPETLPSHRCGFPMSEP